MFCFQVVSQTVHRPFQCRKLKSNPEHIWMSQTVPLQRVQAGVSSYIYKTDRINTNTNTNTNSGLSNDQILHLWERGLLHQCLDCVFRHHPTDDVYDETRVVADL